MQDANDKSPRRLGMLALGALGVVYGDIGTSPLYAMKVAFSDHGLSPTGPNVLATLSAFFWAMTLIISVKYVGLVLRFDNEGEGGVLALTALTQRVSHKLPRLSAFIIGAGVFAAALFYGDAIITPAISVLSAVEGLSVATPRLEHLVVPVTIGILVGLFMIQRHGTGRVGGLFGPITILWFASLAVLGAISIAQTPVVLKALNPLYAVNFAIQQPYEMFILLTAVFLALTGGEALYADMGHFGARAVRLAWYGLVCPALLINYFGQGALLIRSPHAIENPFYFLTPDTLLMPMVVLATAATVIASQATISGAYSMTLQASRLGYLPRIRLLHTSDTERGQIYIPVVNWLMLASVILLVLGFGSSDALANAYGIAVSGTMLITTLMIGVLAWLKSSRYKIFMMLALAAFGLMESLFLSSNLTKFMHGGWLPLTMGIAIYLLLTTWKEGSKLVADNRRKIDIPMKDFLQGPMPDVPRIPGTAIYLTSDPALVPSALFHNLKHFKVMHERIIFLNVLSEDVPRIPIARRIELQNLDPTIYSLTVRFGFRDEPDLRSVLELTRDKGLDIEPMDTTFFIARSTIVEGPGGLPPWRCNLYSWMTRQAESAASFFNLPPNQVVEMGTQVML